ncbi:hypothetical protein [Stenomitos frigidus]|uniref:Uncharacterized protein n=2 Tax=Stenomitos TaxID=1844270 RepID=A0A2T1E2V3_9CYAN|nr:hypothetical protein [Stenomitos frigidus]PSB27076.1 hypothetical protein C7B82_17805 [Stenomitos frigidus ULC18]
MSQDLLTSSKNRPALAKYLRFLRYKFSSCFTLAIAPLSLLAASRVHRTHAKIRCMLAIGRINFVGVYGLINDLLW